MIPLSGAGLRQSDGIDFGNLAQGLRQCVFRAASEVSNFFQSSVGQIGARIHGMDTAPPTTASFSPAQAGNAAPLVNAQQAMAPAGNRNYGTPHSNVRFAAGVNASEVYFGETDIALRDGTSTKWEHYAANKGMRSDPSTYLDPQYIQEHLALFDEGAISFITPWAFENFTVDGNKSAFHGRQDGLFVLPAKWAREVIEQCKADSSLVMLSDEAKNNRLVRLLEEKMGIPGGSWSGQNMKLLAVFIDNPRELNLRLVTGREAGANLEWRPGGYTLGGVPEAMIDKAGLHQALAIPFQSLDEVLTDRAPRTRGEI